MVNVTFACFLAKSTCAYIIYANYSYKGEVTWQVAQVGVTTERDVYQRRLSIG